MYADDGKRLFDLALTPTLALPAPLLCLACIVAIRRQDSAPSVFKQIRAGRRRYPFVLYKLRTISADTGDHASHEVSTTQITHVGHVSRQTKLDELP